MAKEIRPEVMFTVMTFVMEFTKLLKKEKLVIHTTFHKKIFIQY